MSTWMEIVLYMLLAGGVSLAMILLRKITKA